MSFFVRARFSVIVGREAAFTALARELAARAGEEPGTLTYRWFTAGDGTYVVLEQYADDAAATAHNEAAVSLLAQLPTCATMLDAEIHGTVGPSIRAWADANPRVTIYPDLSADPE